MWLVRTSKHTNNTNYIIASLLKKQTALCDIIWNVTESSKDNTSHTLFLFFPSFNTIWNPMIWPIQSISIKHASTVFTLTLSKHSALTLCDSVNARLSFSSSLHLSAFYYYDNSLIDRAGMKYRAHLRHIIYPLY